MKSKIFDFAKLLYISLSMIFVSSNKNGCELIEDMDIECQNICHDNTELCLAQEMNMLSINHTITMDKFLDFIHLYTVNQTSFEKFASCTRDCMTSVKHDPPSDEDIWNLLECITVPPTLLQETLGCNFTHPL